MSYSVSVIAHLYTKCRNRHSYWAVTAFISTGWRKLQRPTNKCRNIMLSKTINNSLIWRGNTWNIIIPVLIISSWVRLLPPFSCNMTTKHKQTSREPWLCISLPIAKSLSGWCRGFVFASVPCRPDALSCPVFGQPAPRPSKYKRETKKMINIKSLASM